MKIKNNLNKLQKFYNNFEIISPIKYPITAIPTPTTNMSKPLLNIPRPVNVLRAAPTTKCAIIEIVNAVHIANFPSKKKERRPRYHLPVSF